MNAVHKLYIFAIVVILNLIIIMFFNEAIRTNLVLLPLFKIGLKIDNFNVIFLLIKIITFN